MIQQISLLGIHSKNMNQDIKETSAFTTVLFIIIKKQKEFKCPSFDQCIKKACHIYDGMLFGNKNKWHSVICNNHDVREDHYVKWNNPGIGIQRNIKQFSFHHNWWPNIGCQMLMESQMCNCWQEQVLTH